MHEEKNTARATVHIGYDGRVHKQFKGPQARERYENEVRVLEFLQAKDCPFVPRILEKDDAKMYLVTTNRGSRAERITQSKVDKLYAQLEEAFKVRHEDAEARNITYDSQEGRFCVIDFEFATILEPGYPPSPEMRSNPDRSTWISPKQQDNV